MKRFISFVLVLTLVLSVMAMPTSAAEANPGNTIIDSPSKGNFVDEKTSHARFIAAAEAYVSKSEEGLIELNLPQSVISMISEEEYDALLMGIEETNDLITDDILAVTDNLTIYEVDEAELVVQGGNVNKVTWHWWGIRRYASRASANYIANCLNKFSYGSATASAVSSCLGPYGIPAVIIFAFGALRAGWLASDISYYNSLTNRGVIIDLRWIISYKVSCQ